MNYNTSLISALKSDPLKFEIFGLQGTMETITYPVDQIVNPKTTIVIPNLGFPT